MAAPALPARIDPAKYILYLLIFNILTLQFIKKSRVKAVTLPFSIAIVPLF